MVRGMEGKILVESSLEVDNLQQAASRSAAAVRVSAVNFFMVRFNVGILGEVINFFVNLRAVWV